MGAIKWLPFSVKARDSLKNTGFLTVWEGTVRSSKTVTSLIGWVDYVANSRESVFLMSGKTIGALYKNVIGGEFGIENILGSGRCRYYSDQDGNRILMIRGKYGEKICYCVGANDERAFQKIRGMTIGGWYADEVSLYPRSFIEEAFHRSIVSSDRKNFWTMNPESPSHFIYREFLDVYEADQLEGFRLWRFTLEDNLAISEDRKKELKNQYKEGSMFFKRFILGLRVQAEGAVYLAFKDSMVLEDPDAWLANQGKSIAYAAVGLDFGGSGSATAAVLTGLTMGYQEAIVLDELWLPENPPVDEMVAILKEAIRGWKIKYPALADMYCDSEEQLIIKSIRKEIWEVNVLNARKGRIIERIKATEMMMNQGRIWIATKAENLIIAFNSAVYDNKKEDSRLDNGSSNIDSLDAFEYSIEYRLPDILGL